MNIGSSAGGAVGVPHNERLQRAPLLPFDGYRTMVSVPRRTDGGYNVASINYPNEVT